MYHLSTSLLSLLTMLCVLVGCHGTTYYGKNFNERAKINARIMKEPGEGHYKVGVPYQVDGKWYYPKEDEKYDKVGVASWYGPNFHKKRTANGELFDKHQLSAAHPTLPMPSMVWVENLENGQKILVRVNDRGPFVKDREIDLSYAAAKAMGFKDQGTAKVRVTFDKAATDALFYPDGYRKKPRDNVAEWYVQLGAFGHYHMAAKQQLALQTDYASDITQADGLYKLRVGPFASKNRASRALGELKQQMEDAYVVAQ